MPRVIFVIDSYRVSGPAKGLLDFLEATRERLEALTVVFQRGRRDVTEFRQECERRRVRVEVVQERYRFDPALIAGVCAVARAFQPDLIQTHGYKADLAGFVSHRRLRVPWVAFSHGLTDEGPKMEAYHRLDDLLIRRADRIIAVSEARRAALVREGHRTDRLVTVHNAVRLPALDGVDRERVRVELGLDAAAPVSAVVGRLSPEKGHVHFVEAMAQVRRVVPQAQAVILGDGPEESRIRARVAERRLDGVVRFAGYRRDLERVYPALDVLVVPSLSEGLPNVVLEAMAHARPVVGTRVGGVPEVVDHGLSGLLVAPADVPALAAAIVAVLRDETARAAMGRAARERAERSFSVAARVERLLGVYRELLASRGPWPMARLDTRLASRTGER